MYVELMSASNGWFRYQVGSGPSLIQWSSGGFGSQQMACSPLELVYSAYDPASAPANGRWTFKVKGCEIAVYNAEDFRFRLSQAGEAAFFLHSCGRKVSAAR